MLEYNGGKYVIHMYCVVMITYEWRQSMTIGEISSGGTVVL